MKNKPLQNEKCKVKNVKIPTHKPEHNMRSTKRSAQFDLCERLLDFCVRVGKVVDALPRKTPLSRHIAGQLVRCGTSSAPNYEEGCAAESRADFVHKLSVSLKEMRETRFWLRFIVRAELLPAKRMSSMVDEAEQLCNILGKSVVTAKANARQSKGAVE